MKISSGRVWRAGVVGVFAAGLGLGGCSTGYSTTINNKTTQVLFASMNAVNAKRTLDSARIGPNDKVMLSSGEVGDGEIVVFEADTQGNPGYPVSLRLSPGLTVLRVTQETKATDSPLKIEVVPN